MTRYIARRLILLLPVLLIVGFIVFVLVHLTPGDPAVVILGQDATEEQIERLRDQLGLNDPLYIQFVKWFGGVLRLDFGDSIFLNRPVTQALTDRAQPTLLLTFYAMLIQVTIGITFGVVAAVKHTTPTSTAS
ncbi:hypothetical protein BH23CHL2_BH23CHL2_26710 [soil metagenome]